MYIETTEKLKSLIQYKTGNVPYARFIDKLDKYRDLITNWHWHNEVELLFVKYGQVRCSFRGGEAILEEGDAIFINSGLIHRAENLSECELIALVFSADFISPRETAVFENFIRPVLGSTLEYTIFKAGTREGKVFLPQIQKLSEITEIEENSMEIQVRIAQFWLDYYKYVKEGLSPRVMNTNKVSISRLRMMIYYIMQNYSKKIALEDLAQAAKISKSEALRCFRTGLETTPMQFLNEYRISRACDLLKTTDKSITEIAEMTGFDNSGYFSKLFKKAHNTSPKDYRRGRFSAARRD